MEASIMSMSSLLLKKPNRHLPLHRHRRFAFAAPSLSPISPPPAAIVSIPVPRARMQPNANANPLSLSVSATASSNDNGGETTSDGDLSVELSESDPKLVPDDASAAQKINLKLDPKVLRVILVIIGLVVAFRLAKPSLISLFVVLRPFYERLMAAYSETKKN